MFNIICLNTDTWGTLLVHSFFVKNLPFIPNLYWLFFDQLLIHERTFLLPPLTLNSFKGAFVKESFQKPLENLNSLRSFNGNSLMLMIIEIMYSSWSGISIQPCLCCWKVQTWHLSVSNLSWRKAQESSRKLVFECLQAMFSVDHLPVVPVEDCGLSNTPDSMLVIDMGGWKLETILLKIKMQVASV